MTFKLRSEGHEGINHADIWGRAFPAQGTASAKVLVQEGGMGEGEQASCVHRVRWVRERQAREGTGNGRSLHVPGLVGFREGLGIILSKKECYRGGGI